MLGGSEIFQPREQTYDPVDRMEVIDASSFKKVQDLIKEYREGCSVGIVSEKHVSIF